MEKDQIFFNVQVGSNKWRTLFYPTFFLLKVFGLSNVVPDINNKREKKSNTVLKKFHIGRRFSEKLNAFTIFSLLWGFFFILAAQIYAVFFLETEDTFVTLLVNKYGPPSRVVSIVIANHTLSNALVVILFGFMGRAKSMREIFITLWEDTGNRTDPLRPEKTEAIAANQRILCFSFYPVLTVIFVASVSNFFSSAHELYCKEWGKAVSYISYIILLIVISYVVTISIASMTYFILICDLTAERLNEVSRDIEKMSNSNEVINRIEDVMRRHQKLCDLIWSMDEFFSVYIFINYLVCIPESCLLLYQFFTVEKLKKEIGLWALTDIVLLTVLSLYAASVTIAVHDMSDVVHKLFRFELPRRHQMQVTLFLEKLNGPNIGLTCLDFFVLTKGVILKVFSAILTYFLLFLQFRQSKD